MSAAAQHALLFHRTLDDLSLYLSTLQKRKLLRVTSGPRAMVVSCVPMDNNENIFFFHYSPLFGILLCNSESTAASRPSIAVSAAAQRDFLFHRILDDVYLSTKP